MTTSNPTPPAASPTPSTDGLMPSHVNNQNSWEAALKLFPPNAGIVAGNPEAPPPGTTCPPGKL